MSHVPPVLASLVVGVVVGLLAWLADSLIRGSSVHPVVIVLLAVLVAGVWYERLTRDADTGS